MQGYVRAWQAHRQWRRTLVAVVAVQRWARGRLARKRLQHLRDEQKHNAEVMDRIRDRLAISLQQVRPPPLAAFHRETLIGQWSTVNGQQQKVMDRIRDRLAISLQQVHPPR